MSRNDQRLGRDRGFVGVEWAAAIALVLIPMVVLTLGLTQYPARQEAARAAAGEAARAAAIAPDAATANAIARTVAAEVLAAHDQPVGIVDVSLPSWDWGEPLTVAVTVSMPLVDVPGIGTWEPSDWTATSTQRIEDQRAFDP